MKNTKSSKTHISSSDTNLTPLVERGYAIHQQLNLLNEEFKQIKDRLKAEGLARPSEHVSLTDCESEGDQWIVQGSRCECRIIFPGPRLKSEFDPTVRGFATIRNLAGEHYEKLFRDVTNVQIIDHDIPVLVSHRLLRPLGDPPPNGGRYYALPDLEVLRQDAKWLHKASAVLIKHWKVKNADRRTDRPAGALNRPRKSKSRKSNPPSPQP